MTHTLSLCLLPLQSGYFVVIGKLAKYLWDAKKYEMPLFLCVLSGNKLIYLEDY